MTRKLKEIHRQEDNKHKSYVVGFMNYQDKINLVLIRKLIRIPGFMLNLNFENAS